MRVKAFVIRRETLLIEQNTMNSISINILQ
jgi:hypothetical protein